MSELNEELDRFEFEEVFGTGQRTDDGYTYPDRDLAWHGWKACMSKMRSSGPGSTIRVMRGPCGGLYLSGVEDLREGDVFRREVRG